MAGPEVLLFYDADCGLCTFFRNWVHRLDVRRRVRSIPLASREADPYLGRLDPKARFGSMHVSGPDGSLASEGIALLHLLEALPLLGGLSRNLIRHDRSREVAEWAYTFLALLREALSA